MIARFSLQGVDLRPRFNRRVDLRPRQDDGGCSGRGDRGEWHQDRRASERRGREDRSYQRGERDGDRRDEREVGRRRDDDRRGVERSSNAHDITRPRDFPNRERPPRRAQDDERSHQRDRVALGTGRRDNQDQQRSSHREDQGRIDDRSGRGRVENGHEQQEHAKLLAELQKSCRYEEDEIQRLKASPVLVGALGFQQVGRSVLAPVPRMKLRQCAYRMRPFVGGVIAMTFAPSWRRRVHV
mmetsp:Transcript_4749/g.10119  ORF Transcript_4749/g.10119 Transcript_4749/m.10119 type:complete len:241 (-) Transcript_4749:731-1453(-)